MSHDDPLQPLRTLMERLAELADQVGLKMETFAVLPNPDPHGKSMVQAILEIDTDMVFKTEDQRAEEKMLRDMELHMRRDTVQEKIEEARRKALETAAELAGGDFVIPENLPEIKPEDAELINCPQCEFDLSVSPISQRPDHLFCERCKWPAIERTPEEVQAFLNPQPEPEATAIEPATSTDDDPFAGMSIEDMLAEMARRDKEGNPPDDGLAGV